MLEIESGVLRGVEVNGGESDVGRGVDEREVEREREGRESGEGRGC